MQLLSLVAMEPPVSLAASSIHDEKVKVLQAIRPFQEAILKHRVSEANMALDLSMEKTSWATGRKKMSLQHPMSRLMPRCAFLSTIGAGPAFLFICAAANDCPNGPQKSPSFSKILLAFFSNRQDKRNEPNIFAIRIQPDEGTALKINCKVPGPCSPIQPVKMDFRYGSYFGMSPPEAYERLILDCILGDNTLFAREDEVFNSWHLLTPILEYWANTKAEDFPNYHPAPGDPKLPTI